MKSILIIDDDKALCRSLEIHLELAGFSVRSAFTGEDGLYMAMHWQPDLVLLDINLPDQSGFSVLPQIRRQLPTIQVIMISASSQHEFSQINTRHEDVGFLEKPLGLGDLIEVLSAE